MFRIKKTEYFSKWRNLIKDDYARAKIDLRIEQTKLGNFGDFKFVVFIMGRGIASIIQKKMMSLFFCWWVAINQRNKRILKRLRS